jgi:outer membrane biosynthesis protein TonB
MVHAPADAGDPSAPDIVAMVRFTIAKGAIENSEVITGTGNAVQDELLLQQVAAAKVPKIYGPQADTPHEFELQLKILTPVESFEYNVYAAIDWQKLYPKESVMRGAMGNATVDFDYVDGKATNIAITKSSRDRDLDKASLGSVSRAQLPAAPSTYSGKPLHMEVIVCYVLNDSIDCPSGQNVIEVRGSRIKTVEITTVRGGY